MNSRNENLKDLPHSDKNNPAHPEELIVYALSYESLTSADRIEDTIHFHRNTAPSDIGYGYYRPGLKAQ